jgi:hypothetical protein
MRFCESPCTPKLLLLDDFSGHWSDEVVENAKAINVTIMKVPPNATSVAQPADATWNGLLKARLRNTWIGDLREQLRARTPNQAFKLVPPCRRRLCSWICAAWSDIAASIIIAGFMKCGLLGDAAEEFPEEQVEVQDAGDVVGEVIRAGLIDEAVGQFSLEDDFDEVFHAVVSVSAEI